MNRPTMTSYWLPCALAALLVLGGQNSTSARGPRWRRLDVGLATVPMQAVYAYDSLHVWASSAFGDVLYSKDGGFNWNSFPLGNVCCPGLAGGSIAKAFFFFDTLNGWITGEANNATNMRGFRLHTTDGGKSWSTQIDFGEHQGVQLIFFNEKKGIETIRWDCALTDSFLVTNDSGRTWPIRTTGVPSCWTKMFDFVDSSNGWAVIRYPPPGDTFGLLRTRDGGSNWAILQFPTAYCIGANIQFLDTLNGWLLHCEPSDPYNKLRLSRTIDGGITWDSIYTFGSGTFYLAFQALDSSHLWLAGTNGSGASVKFSADQGRSWIETMPGVGDEIDGFYATDSSHAFGVGAQGYVYAYSPTMIGDLNLDWTVTTADVMLMLNYTFLNLPTSVAPEDMDFNNDCEATSADVVLLLMRVFLGFPQLQWGCAQP